MKMNFRATAAALMLASVGTAMVATTAPAAADEYGTDAVIGAAAGALIGTLLLDSNRDQYYYVNNYHRVYVSNDYASRWHSWHRQYGYDRPYGYAAYNGGNREWHGDRGWQGGDRGDWHGGNRGDWHGGDRGNWQGNHGGWHGDDHRADHDGRGGDHGDWHR